MPNLDSLRCPECGSENYGYDLEEATGRKHWSCLDCKLGINSYTDQEYAAQYAYACGYRD